jgi:hypothetical protein
MATRNYYTTVVQGSTFPDLFEGTLYAAWSLRYVRPAWATAGNPVAVVTRADGLVVENLYPQAGAASVGDYLKTSGGSTIATIAAGQACYYTTLYDQSGNGYDSVNQSTIANGLLAYDGANYIQHNSKPAFSKATAGFFRALTNIAQPYTFLGYADFNSRVGGVNFLYDTVPPITLTRAGLFARSTGDSIAIVSQTTANGFATTPFNYFQAYYNDNNSSLTLDNTTSGVLNVGVFSSGPITLLSSNAATAASGWQSVNSCQEIIIVSGQPSAADVNRVKNYYA